MAEDIVAGLFGLSPYQVQQQRQANINTQAGNYAQLDPFQRAAQSMYQGGAGLGQIGAGMLGMVDPAVQAAQQRQQSLQGLDTSNPQAIMQRAAQIQDPQLKSQLVQLAQQVQRNIVKQQKEVAQTNLANVQADEIPKQRHEETLLKIQQAADAAKLRSEDARLAIEQRREAANQHNQLLKLLAEQKAATAGNKISNVDARSIDKSLQASSGANSALQLLDQAEALYGKYASGRDEPILGTAARWGAAVGLGDEKRAADYETAGQIAKDLGVIKLGLIGGSDTERELQVAIDTSPSPDKLPSTNKAIIANQRRAIEVLQAEPDFKTEWVNKYGSLSKLDESGGTYGKAWRKYQKENFRSVELPSDKKAAPQLPAGYKPL